MKFRGDLYRFVGISLVGVALSVLPAGAQSSSSSAGSYKGTPDDFMQISQLFSRYNYTIDNGDGVAGANNFTPDGVFQDPSTCAIGRNKLIAVVGRDPSVGRDQKMHHVPSLGPIVYSDHDHASVHSTVMVVRETAPGEAEGIFITGTYDDQLVRIDGVWLFSYRLVHRPSSTPAVACPALNHPRSETAGFQ